MALESTLSRRSLSRRSRRSVNALSLGDLFDVSFITRYYPDAISDRDLMTLDSYIAERGMNWMEEQMLEDFILNSHAVDHVSMVLCDNVARLRSERRS